jgi:plasmid maintenance system antidote protein VapI
MDHTLKEINKAIAESEQLVKDLNATLMKGIDTGKSMEIVIQQNYERANRTGGNKPDQKELPNG